jgi:hypothetical protein
MLMLVADDRMYVDQTHFRQTGEISVFGYALQSWITTPPNDEPP